MLKNLAILRSEAAFKVCGGKPVLANKIHYTFPPGWWIVPFIVMGAAMWVGLIWGLSELLAGL